MYRVVKLLWNEQAYTSTWEKMKSGLWPLCTLELRMYQLRRWAIKHNTMGHHDWTYKLNSHSTPKSLKLYYVTPCYYWMTYACNHLSIHWHYITYCHHRHPFLNVINMILDNTNKKNLQLSIPDNHNTFREDNYGTPYDQIFNIWKKHAT